jgi:hypothetical protein
MAKIYVLRFTGRPGLTEFVGGVDFYNGIGSTSDVKDRDTLVAKGYCVDITEEVEAAAKKKAEEVKK